MKKNKKVIKITVLICSCILAAVLLTSCNLLDDLRAKRVDVLDEDGSIMEYRGTKYKKLPESMNFKLTHCIETFLYSVDSDVPLLLTEEYGESCYYCGRKDVLIKDRFSDGAMKPQYFCTLDKYEEYCEAFKLKELECYKFEYRTRDTVTGRHNEPASYMLDEELTAIINEAVEKGEQEQIRGVTGYGNWIVVSLSKCDPKDLVELKDSCTLFNDNEGNYGVIVTERNNIDSKDITFVKFSDEHDQRLSELFRDYHYLLLGAAASSFD